MHPQILTVRYEVHEGDVTREAAWPLGQTALTEMVQANFAQGEWTISGQVGDVSFAGRGESRQKAVLQYLEARLIDTQRNQGE